MTSVQFIALGVFAQVNSGSDGRDGALDLTTNGTLPNVVRVIDMADHPDGIYHYTSVKIPANGIVSFIPNANNTPVVWLVKSNCVIDGTVHVSGQPAQIGIGIAGGPGGYRGGNGGTFPSGGQGPGGGSPGGAMGKSASYATHGFSCAEGTNGASAVYGNQFLLPLLGGSGGGGGTNGSGGGGGGGALLIAASKDIELNGTIGARGGNGFGPDGTGAQNGAAGSGGGVRLVASKIIGRGVIDVLGGGANCGGSFSNAGSGRVRLDSPDLNFGGTVQGVFSQGFQPIIIPAAGQGAQLAIATVGGVTVPPNPSSSPANPAVTIPGQQANPITIVVHCSNIPLNTPVTVNVKPVNGSTLSVAGSNNAGTQESSAATVFVNMPRGGGVIHATAAIGLAANQGASLQNGSNAASYAQTGLTTGGERFTTMEITTALGGRQEVAYITESGKRYSLAAK